MTRGHIHIIGAGMAGLSAAVELAAQTAGQGHSITLYEAAGHAGGRCRSFHDRELDRRIDNGNHLMLSANHGVLRYLAQIGAPDGLQSAQRARFDFCDLASQTHWALDLGHGRLPWGLLSPKGRIPGVAIRDYLSALRLRNADPEQSVAAVLGDSGAIYERLWAPLSVAVLNTEPETAQAALLWPVLKEAFASGATSCRPMFAPDGLSAALVDPALDYLRARGVSTHFHKRLRTLDMDDAGPTRLDFGDDSVPFSRHDRVILALPPWALNTVLSDIETPQEYRPIINAHFVLPDSGHSPTMAQDKITMIGLINGTAHWLFLRDDVASLTISAAGPLLDIPAHDLAQRLWREVVVALGLQGAGQAMPPLGPYRIIIEKRATIAQIPQETARRAAMQTRWRNLLLAGDWTDTGLPATIEGAVRSGARAARGALAGL